MGNTNLFYKRTSDFNLQDRNYNVYHDMNNKFIHNNPHPVSMLNYNNHPNFYAKNFSISRNLNSRVQYNNQYVSYNPKNFLTPNQCKFRLLYQMK